MADENYNQYNGGFTAAPQNGQPVQGQYQQPVQGQYQQPVQGQYQQPVQGQYQQPVQGQYQQPVQGQYQQPVQGQYQPMQGQYPPMQGPMYQPPKKKKGKTVAIVLACCLIPILIFSIAAVAVLAPQYVKYVEKSRDAAMATFAEDYLMAAKTVYADAEMGLGGSGVITLYCDENSGEVMVDYNGLSASTIEQINYLAGLSEGKTIKSDDVYIITITEDFSFYDFTINYTFNMVRQEYGY